MQWSSVLVGAQLLVVQADVEVSRPHSPPFHSASQEGHVSAVQSWCEHPETPDGNGGWNAARQRLWSSERGAQLTRLNPRNPCRIKGAGKEKAAERRIATVAQADRLAEAMGMRWRLMVYLGAYGPTRPEELAGLRCGDVGLYTLRIRVRLAEPERMNGADGSRATPGARLEPGDSSRVPMPGASLAPGVVRRAGP